MNCRIIVVDTFKREVKRLIKKHASLKGELAILESQLSENPRLGVQVHENTFKIKLAVRSKGKGKSGGLRVITHVVELEVLIEEQENETILFLLSIYDKSEMENISDSRLRSLVETALKELEEDPESL